MAKESRNPMWGGRFTSGTASSLAHLNSSISVDKRLYKQDIKASQVYAKALLKAKILNESDCTAIIDGLEQVREEWDADKMVILEQDEDIHSANERRLRELVGGPADHLHAGRSRNDQVATDVRLWLLENIPHLQNILSQTIKTIVDRAKKEIDILMPGYTHLQRAQPVRWSHFILSHAWSLKEDGELLKVTHRRTGVLPLGSGALAGNPFCVDRQAMADELGFNSISMNSMNAVGNRDFIAEFLFWCSMCSAHISRLAEDLIIFSTAEFGFVRVSEKFSTGSSLLPQKRNPDGLELARAAAAQLLGASTAFMATLKSLPSTYNKDLQGDKKLLFESFDTIYQVLNVVDGTLSTLTVDAANCTKALGVEQLAARLAHWLVKRGLPFRRAHHAAGRAVAVAEAKGLPLNLLPALDRAAITEHLGEDLSNVWNFESAVEEHETLGGTARSSVLHQIDVLEEWLKQF